MKSTFPIAVAILVLAASLYVSGVNAPESSSSSQQKFLIAKLPPSNIDLVFNTSDKVVKINKRRITPLDSLGRDGWHLVDGRCRN